MFRPFLILTHARHVLRLDETGTPELPKPPGLLATLSLMPPHIGDPLLPTSPVLKLQAHAAVPGFFIYMDSEFQIPILTLAQPAVYRLSCLPSPYLLILMQVVTLSSLEILRRLSTPSQRSQTGINFTETFKFHNAILGQIELYRTYHLCYKT